MIIYNYPTAPCRKRTPLARQGANHYLGGVFIVMHAVSGLPVPATALSSLAVITRLLRSRRDPPSLSSVGLARCNCHLQADEMWQCVRAQIHINPGPQTRVEAAVWTRQPRCPHGCVCAIHIGPTFHTSGVSSFGEARGADTCSSISTFF